MKRTVTGRGSIVSLKRTAEIATYLIIKNKIAIKWSKSVTPQLIQYSTYTETGHRKELDYFTSSHTSRTG